VRPPRTTRSRRGTGDEPQRAFDLPDETGDRQAQHDSRKSGKIINIASIAGLAGNSADMSTLAYNTSKAAVVNFTRTLAGEWASTTSTSNALARGNVPSKMTKGDDRADRRRESGRPRAAPAASATTTTSRADAAVRVARRKHITGQVLPIDGGVSAIIAA
jgi:gluconate 5-dehydrogenase